MPRAPNEKVKQAQEMYQKGMKLVEIAQQLELPAGTIRRWKNTYQWVSERSEKKANVRKEKCDNPKEIDYSRKEEILSSWKIRIYPINSDSFALTILELLTRQNPIKKRMAAVIKQHSLTGRHYSEILGLKTRSKS